MKIYGIDGKMNITGERVKSARIKKAYSQADLAREMQKLGVTIEQKAIS